MYLYVDLCPDVCICMSTYVLMYVSVCRLMSFYSQSCAVERLRCHYSSHRDVIGWYCHVCLLCTDWLRPSDQRTGVQLEPADSIVRDGGAWISRTTRVVCVMSL